MSIDRTGLPVLATSEGKEDLTAASVMKFSHDKEELLADKAITTKQSADDDDVEDEGVGDQGSGFGEKNAKKPRRPRKAPASGQQEMEF